MKISERGKFILDTAETQFLKDNFETMSNKELSDHFGLKIQTLRPILYGLGLYRMKLEFWTSEQIKFLKENFKTIGDLELAKIFEEKWPKNKKWTLKHIEKKRKYLKLKRTKKELSEIKERNVLSGCWLTHKTWKTRGESEIGTIKIWKTTLGLYFPVIKTESGFVHYYRWLWVKNYGEIKSDELVVPKLEFSRDKLLTIEELEIVDRAEHARRNVEKIKNTPGEIKEIVRLINKIRKEVSHGKKQR